ncbi:MAG: Restriction endonuclease [bacterium ADurb.Bin157]|nr:MAG: Restriction endonuclease [bacterium ADurb.Bin157]
MNYWLHRISHMAELSYPLLKKGILSIGWADCSEKDFLSKAHDPQQFDVAFKEVYKTLYRSRYSLWRFTSEMKQGDWVLVPSGNTFSIFELTEDAAFCLADLNVNGLKDCNGKIIVKGNDGGLYKETDEKDSNFIDLGFFRKVKTVVENIPRYEYCDADLTSRMKIYNTNCKITDLRASIDSSIAKFRKSEPINLQEEVITKTLPSIFELINSKLNPDKFEFLVKWYLEKVGATAVIPSKNAKKEGDVDIVATFERTRTIIFVQVKFHRDETDDTALTQILEYRISQESMDDEYSRIAWVVTSAEKFSKKCIEAARENRVQLINGKQFARMLLEIGISNLQQAF